MATRSRTVFVTLAELEQFLLDDVAELGATVLVDAGPDVQLTPWPAGSAELASARCVFVAKGPLDVSSLPTGNDVVVAQRGWVQIDVPRTVGACLHCIQIAARTDWFDGSSGSVREEPAAAKLFEALWRRAKPRFTFPTIGRNKVTGAEASYRSIGFSDGAAKWLQQGGKWCQQGVENVEFDIAG